MLFVQVISVKLAASRRFKLISVWAKTFIDSAGELPRIVFTQKQLHFILLAALEAINTSKFTQLLS
jgi:hypothetical protein